MKRAPSFRIKEGVQGIDHYSLEGTPTNWGNQKKYTLGRKHTGDNETEGKNIKTLTLVERRDGGCLSLLVVGLVAPHGIPLVDVLVGLGVVEALVVHGSLRTSLEAISHRGQFVAEARRIKWVEVFGRLVVPVGGGRRGSRR